MQLKRIGDYPRRRLISIYATKHGEVFAKANQAVKDAVPELVVIDGVKYRHMSVYFDPQAMKFAYYSVALDSFKYLTYQQITDLINKETKS